MGVRVCLTGHLAIERDGSPVATTGIGPLGRLALAYLVTERQRPVGRDELADLLWGEDLPRSWETSLRVVVSKLRALLVRAGLEPATALTTRFGCYELRLPTDAVVDVEAAAAELAAANDAMAAGRADEARLRAGNVVVVAGRRFLSGVPGPWVERRQAALRELHLQGLDTLAGAAAACGDWAAAAQAAETAVALEPFREPMWVRLMDAHAGAGNRGEALRCYQRCRRLLVEELGVSPSPDTEAAHLLLLTAEDRPPLPVSAGGGAGAVPVTATSLRPP